MVQEMLLDEASAKVGSAKARCVNTLNLLEAFPMLGVRPRHSQTHTLEQECVRCLEVAQHASGAGRLRVCLQSRELSSLAGVGRSEEKSFGLGI